MSYVSQGHIILYAIHRNQIVKIVCNQEIRANVYNKLLYAISREIFHKETTQI